MASELSKRIAEQIHALHGLEDCSLSGGCSELRMMRTIIDRELEPFLKVVEEASMAVCDGRLTQELVAALAALEAKEEGGK